MITTTDFRDGLIYRDTNGAIVQIIEYQHHRKSQARAVVRVKLKNLETGAIVETTYRPEDKFEDVTVEKRPQTYLYTESGQAHFMDAENYEQMHIEISKIQNVHKFLVDNMEVMGLYLDGKFFSIELPVKVKLKIKHTVPGVKGDSVANLTKFATLESGLEIKVPLFVNEGDAVVVDSRTGEYVERV